MNVGRSYSTILKVVDLLNMNKRPPAMQAGSIADRYPSHMHAQKPNADTIAPPPFFFWSVKKGGSSAPSEPPLATCLPAAKQTTAGNGNWHEDLKINLQMLQRVNA